MVFSVRYPKILGALSEKGIGATITARLWLNTRRLRRMVPYLGLASARRIALRSNLPTRLCRLPYRSRMRVPFVVRGIYLLSLLVGKLGCRETATMQLELFRHPVLVSGVPCRLLHTLDQLVARSPHERIDMRERPRTSLRSYGLRILIPNFTIRSNSPVDWPSSPTGPSRVPCRQNRCGALVNASYLR